MEKSRKFIGCLLVFFMAIIAFVGVVVIIAAIASKLIFISFLFLFLFGCILYILWLYYRRIMSGQALKGIMSMSFEELVDQDLEIEEKIVEACKNSANLCHGQSPLGSNISDLQLILGEKTDKQKQKILRNAFKSLVKQLLMEGLVSEEQGIQIMTFFEDLNANIDNLKRQKEYVQFCKLLVINCILSGKLPTGVVANTGGQFVKFAETECPIADQSNAVYSEVREVKNYYGISSGSSMQIGKGRYSRWGSFMSSSTTSLQAQKAAKGTLLLTNESIYFFSDLKTTKIPYDKVLSYKAYSDGIGINLKDSHRRPIIITGIDGWFVYNIVTNIENLS